MAAETATMDEEAAHLLAIMTGEVPSQGAVSATGTARVLEVVSKGGGEEENAVPVVAKLMQDAGLVTIWDVKTGEPSLTNRNMLPTQLRKLSPDGQRMFTLVKPNITPVRGTHKCLLHPDDPNRAEYDKMGFPTCRKTGMLSLYYVNTHMRIRHKTCWETIEQMREREEKRIDRDLQRDIQRRLADAALGRVEVEGDDTEESRPRRRGRPRQVVADE